MSLVILAIAPIFGLILVGYMLRRIEFPGAGFWPVSERLTYYVLLPALLVQGLSGKNIQADGLPLVGAVLGAVLSGALVARLLWPVLKLDGPAYTSLFQGAFRPNTYIGLSIASTMLGPHWMTLSAVALLAMIPVINVICVLTLSRHGKSVNGVTGVGRQLATNPLILACLVGLFMNGLHISFPQVVNDLLDILGRAALPMGLLAVGAGLRLEKVTGGKRTMVGVLGGSPVCSAVRCRRVVLPVRRGCGCDADGRDLHRDSRVGFILHSCPSNGWRPPAHVADHHFSNACVSRDPAADARLAQLIF